MDYILDPIRFIQPAIGNSYFASSKKNLVLGESTYSPTGGILPTDHLISLTNKYADPKDKFTYIFWTNIMQTMVKRSKKEMLPEEVKSFWDSIILHDYVCDRHERNIGEHIPLNAWETSRDQFMKIIDKCSPNRVIVFSKRVEQDLRKIPNIVIDNSVTDRIGRKTIVTRFDLLINESVIPAIAFPHPSWYFNYKKFVQYF
jgi:hypothetical protein